MRKCRFCLQLLAMFALLGSTAFSQVPHGENSPERVALEAANVQYERDLANAKKAYDEAVRQASKKLLKAYDTSITSAMRRGGGDGLDLANALNTEKKTFQARIDANEASQSKEPATSLNRDKLRNLLTSKVWYFHWEEQPPNRNHPIRFLPNGKVEGNPGGEWTIEPIWVVKHANSYHVPIDENTMRGFFIPTGRQTGIIADEKK